MDPPSWAFPLFLLLSEFPVWAISIACSLLRVVPCFLLAMQGARPDVAVADAFNQLVADLRVAPDDLNLKRQVKKFKRRDVPAAAASLAPRFKMLWPFVEAVSTVPVEFFDRVVNVGARPLHAEGDAEVQVRAPTRADRRAHVH
jgi:hypothetical protein